MLLDDSVHTVMQQVTCRCYWVTETSAKDLVHGKSTKIKISVQIVCL